MMIIITTTHVIECLLCTEYYVLYIHYLVNFYRSECTDEEAEQSYVKCRVMQLI